jgi:hypothetical protein
MTTSWIRLLMQESQMLMNWLDGEATARRLFDGSIDAAAYARYLTQMYHYVRWTTPLVAQAGRRIAQLGRHPALAELIIQKAAERREQEHLLLGDLRTLGWTAERVEATAPSPAVVAYAAWNRFTLEAGAPTAFLGTTYALEFLSAQRAAATVERLIARGIIPKIRMASTFLIDQTGVDTNCLANLTAVLRGLPDQEEQEAILLSARMTRSLCVGFFHKPASRVSGMDGPWAPAT